MPDSTTDLRIARAVTLAEGGASLSEIAAEFQVSTRTASRLVQAGGARVRIPGGKKIGKKPMYLQRVLELHDANRTVGEISDEVGDVHHTTVAAWLKESGRTPRYDGSFRIPANVIDHPEKEAALQRYLAGESAPALSQELGLSSRTVEWWAKQASIWGQGGIQKRQREDATKAVQLFRQGEALASIVSSTRLDYYQVRAVLDEAGVHPYPEEDKPDVFCPCGKKTGSPNRGYCSPECRMEHGKKKQADPQNWTRYTCQNCGDEFELRKSSQSYGKYCSNACAKKHTKTKQHIVVDDAVVLDSGYEALFWGLCTFLKVPVERYDRKHGVERREGQWYAPDFYLPTLNMAVEVKGVQDEDDAERWDAFRKASPQYLRVILQGDLTVLIGRGTTRDKFVEYLRTGGA